MNTKAIGKRLKDLRTEKKLSQDEVAKLIGVGRTTYVKYETGSINQSRKLQALSNIFHVSVDYLLEGITAKLPPLPPHVKRIPILGHVVAGNPTTAIEDIEGYEEIDTRYSPYKNGEFFALRVKGDSMQPTLNDGDIIIIKKQNYIEDREIAVVLVDGDEATVKEVKESDGGITLIGHNAYVYSPHFYSHEEIDNLSVAIIGKVVEMRRRF